MRAVLLKTLMSWMVRATTTTTTTTTKHLIMVEHSRIFPSPNGSLCHKSLPLSYFDIPWIQTHPIHCLFFHELPQTKSQLINTTIPNLKHSLSITLKHFFPFAGNLILFPFTDSTSLPKIPEIRYVEGDSVSFTVVESRNDFEYFTNYHSRKANEFYPLVPKLGDHTRKNNSEGTIQVPLLAIQVTLFPNNGICIGITSHHVVGDANSYLSFIKAWALITKFGNDNSFLSSGFLPVFDKSLIKDSSGIEKMLWSHLAKTLFQGFPPTTLYDSCNDDLVRATFIITKDKIDKVKKFILANKPTITRLSTFTIVCGHVWTCIAKARDAVGQLMEPEIFFGCLVNCRGRLDPPLPETYFGNCLVPLSTVIAKRDQLVGKEGFFYAVGLIGDAIEDRVKSKESIDAGAEIWTREFRECPTYISGSPKFDFNDTDFGWGKPKKFEEVSLDYTLSVSLSRSRESEQDIEIGLSLPKKQMDVFETIFTKL